MNPPTLLNVPLERGLVEQEHMVDWRRSLAAGRSGERGAVLVAAVQKDAGGGQVRLLPQGHQFLNPFDARLLATGAWCRAQCPRGTSGVPE